MGMQTQKLLLREKPMNQEYYYTPLAAHWYRRWNMAKEKADGTKDQILKEVWCRTAAICNAEYVKALALKI